MLAWRATDGSRPGASSGLGGIMTRVTWILLSIAPFTSAYDLDPDDKSTCHALRCASPPLGVTVNTPFPLHTLTR